MSILFLFSRVQLLSGPLKGDHPCEVRMVPGEGLGRVQDGPLGQTVLFLLFPLMEASLSR